LGFVMALRLTRRVACKTVTALLPIPRSCSASCGCPIARAKRASSRWKISSASISIGCSRAHGAASGVFRILRDSDIEVAEEAEDLVRLYETMLKRRRRGSVIRSEMQRQHAARSTALHRDHLIMGLREPFVVDGILGLDETKQLILEDRHDLQFEPFTVALSRSAFAITAAIASRRSSQGPHCPPPSESFDVVVQFLRSGGARPRRSSLSSRPSIARARQPIVRALVEAAEAGKSVRHLSN
jgi:polyphosphate kinase